MLTIWLQRADSLGRWFENALLTVFFITLLLLSGSQIVLRNFFSSGLPWADGLIRILVLWLAVVGAIAATRDSKHIAIELITRSMPPNPRRYVQSFINFLAASIAGVFAWQAWRFVNDSRLFEDVLVADWPAWLLQLILPIGFALIAYRFIVRAVASLRIDPGQP